MEYRELIDIRRSIRSFANDHLSDDLVDRVLEAARFAPSAGNLQSFQMVVARDAGVRKKLAHAAWGQESLAQAPVVIAFLADRKHSAAKYGTRGRELYSYQDATIAATYAMLAATDLGLGCVWVGAFDVRKVAEILNYRDEEVPVALLAIGHADETPEARPRRDITELVRRL